MCGGNGSFNLRLCVWACNIHSVRLVCSSCLALLWMQIRYPPIIVPWPPLVWTPDHSGRVWGITLLRLEFHEIYILHALFSYLQCDRSANFQYSMSCHAFTLVVELKHRLVGGCFCFCFFVLFCFSLVCLFVSLVNSNSTIPALKTLPCKFFHQTLTRPILSQTEGSGVQTVAFAACRIKIVHKNCEDLETTVGR